MHLHGTPKTKSAAILKSGLPSNEEILAQLEVIAKRAFRAGRDRGETQQLDILRHVVSEKLKGRSSSERSILAFLGREPPHKAATGGDDPTARVHMGHIRRKLGTFYREEGWSAIIDIVLRPGQYTPEISKRKQEERLSDHDRNALRRAQAANDKQSLPACAEALEHLDSVRHDPEHLAVALSIRADTYVIRALQGMPPKQELEKAYSLASKALEISPKYSQAHTICGFVHSSCGRWSEASKAFRRGNQYALPGNPAHFEHVAYLVARGRLAEAIRLTEEAAGMIPGYYAIATQALPVMLADLGFLQLLDDDLNAAKTTLHDAIRAAPADFYMPHIYLAIAHEAGGDWEKGLAVLDELSLVPERSALTWGMRALLRGVSDGQEDARSELGKLTAAKGSGSYVPASQFVIAHIGVGDYDRALASIQQMANDGEPLIHWLGYYPFLRHIANDPQYGQQFRAVLENDVGVTWRWKRRLP